MRLGQLSAWNLLAELCFERTPFPLSFGDPSTGGLRAGARPLGGTVDQPAVLSQDQRFELADLQRTGVIICEIARRLGRAPSTISRERQRNAIPAKGYRPFEAHRRATAGRTRARRRRIEANSELQQVVGEVLSHRWSPQLISRHLRQRFPHEPAMWLRDESIYQALYQPGSPLMRPSASQNQRLPDSQSVFSRC